jgi:molecular chaperone HtpG
MTKTTLSLRFEQSKLYNQMIEKLHDEDSGVKANALKIINDAGEYALLRLKTVIKNMPEFTLHDEEHVFNILFIMEKLIPPNTLSRLSVPEVMLLILTAFFHDIGMAPEEKYLRAWKGDLEGLDTEFAMIEQNKYIRFRNSNVKKVEEIQRLHDENKHSVAQTLEEYLISEYIRITHAERAREIIAKDWNGKIFYKNVDLTSIFARLCFSHNEDAMQLLEFESFELCDHDTYICIPFIAAILRLADIIDFDPKRTPSILFSHLAVRHPISLAEWKKHQAITAWTISSDKLIYSEKCKHPAIEASIRSFCDVIDNELKNCNLILNSINNPYNIDISHYKIDLPKQVDRSKIKAMTDILTDAPIYKYQNTKFALNKNQIIDLLMGTQLYGKSEVALRELIQNSIDACLVREKMCKAWGEEYTPHISVSYYSKNNIDYLEVKDNGIGMDQHIIDNYYSNVGSSYYKSREFYDLMSEVNFNYKPISRFGIGILSYFMVSDSLEVDSKRVVGKYKYTDALKVIVEGYDSIFYIRQGDRTEPGTTTILQLRKVHPWQRLSGDEFKKSVKSILQLPPFEIDIVTSDEIEKYNSSEFLHLDPNSLKEYSWHEDDNIQEIGISLNNDEYGFKGSAIIGILVKMEDQ